MSVNKLALVIGHTQLEPGAKGVDPLNCYEYDYNREVAEIAYRYARGEFGLECKVFSRDRIGLAGCYSEVSEWCKHFNSVCIELHFNSFDHRSKGTETLFDDDPSDSVDFARLLQEGMCMLFKREGKFNRGIKKRIDDRGARNLALCKVTGALVEPFFGDNKADALLGHALKFEYAKLLVECAHVFLTDKAKEKSIKAIQ